MNVLITGVQNAVEESIVRIAAERLSGKDDFRLLCFSDFDGLEGSALEELASVKSAQQKVKKAVQAKMAATTRGHLIVSGYCTVKTKLGFFPVITQESVKALKPDMMVHINVDPLALEGKGGDEGEFADQQEVEKTYSLMLCASVGCGLKIIHCGLDGSRKAADELLSLLKAMMVNK